MAPGTSGAGDVGMRAVKQAGHSKWLLIVHQAGWLPSSAKDWKSLSREHKPGGIGEGSNSRHNAWKTQALKDLVAKAKSWPS